MTGDTRATAVMNMFVTYGRLAAKGFVIREMLSVVPLPCLQRGALVGKRGS